MKKYIAVFEVEDDCNILTMDAEIKYTYETNGTNYELREGIEFVRVEEPEPCEDCISRAKAIEEADKLCLETGYDNEKVIEMLNDLPSVTPKEKTGMWRVQRTETRWIPSDTIFICSQCGHKKSRTDGEIIHFCPNCGARMT